MDKAHVAFCVFGFGDNPSVVTELMGVEPTEVWAKGDPTTGHPAVARNHSRWVLKSPLDLERDVEDHIEALLSILERRSAAVFKVAERFDTQITCAVYYADFTPGIHLSEDLIRRVAALGLCIDLDLFFFGE